MIDEKDGEPHELSLSIMSSGSGYHFPSASVAGGSLLLYRPAPRLSRNDRPSTTPWTRPSPAPSGGAGCWTGVYGTIEELAAAERINPSYVSRVLRMTLLAPDIVEAILDGSQPHELTLAVLMRSLPLGWAEQRCLEFPSISTSTSDEGE